MKILHPKFQGCHTFYFSTCSDIKGFGFKFQIPGQQLLNINHSWEAHAHAETFSQLPLASSLVITKEKSKMNNAGILSQNNKICVVL